MSEDYSSLIRTIPDFPEPGIMFRDITPLLQDSNAYQQAIHNLCVPFEAQKIDQIVAIEARGYLLGAPMALKLNAGFIPVRKEGKLPFDTIKAEYTLEYGHTVIEMHKDALMGQDKVLIVDDVLATGGTLKATIALVEQLGATVAGIAVLIELEALGGRSQLGEYQIFSLLTI